MSAVTLTEDLALRDLTDPYAGPHAVQEMTAQVIAAVQSRWPAGLILDRGDRIVDVADNYDRLGYSPDARTRDARHTRYVSPDRMLRSQTSALIPPVLRRLAAAGRYSALIACPGVVYRRDVIDRLHTGTPHQLDLWLLWPTTPVPPPRTSASSAATSSPSRAVPAVRSLPASGSSAVVPASRAPVVPADRSSRDSASSPAVPADRSSRASGSALVVPADRPSRASAGPVALPSLVEAVVSAALPGAAWRVNPATHPYTSGGVEIEACVGGDWVEIGEAGHAARSVLAGAGLPAYVSGLAMGLGLDRLVMLRKGIPDIRLLRSPDPRVAGQMLDLAPYRPVSAHPAARRDVSVAVHAGITPEEIGDTVRTALGPDAHLVEEMTIRSTTAIADLPSAARARLGIRPGEVNVLLRVVLRDLNGSIAVPKANALRDRVYDALHHR